MGIKIRSATAFAFTMAAILGCSNDDRDSADAAAGSPGPAQPPGAARPSASGSGGAAGASFGGGLAAGPDAADESGANAGDSYSAVGTNPFVVAAHDPLSTFGADVDTASCDIFRRDVNLGMAPQPESVRLEEYVNSFDYDYPAPLPTDPHPFDIHLAAAPHLLQRGTTLLRVAIQSQKRVEVEKKPANVVFLVDTSGSMQSPDKLPLVQYTLTRALDMLAPTDQISIVSYAGDVAVRLTPTAVSNRDTIVTAINELTSGGGTNGGAGIKLAYEQARAGFIEGGINHIVLCTDGDFNLGLSSNGELVKLVELERQSGVTLTALGYGVGNLNDSMMEAISNKGNGVYGVISSEGQAAEYVENRLLSSLQLLAKDMKLQVEFNPEKVYAYRLLGYENRDIADNDFRNDAIDAGEVGAGHRVTALYELVLTGGAIPQANSGMLTPDDGSPYAGQRQVGADDLVLVKVRYKNLDATDTDTALEVAESLAPAAVLPTFGSADLDLQWAVAIAAFAEIMKESPYADPQHLDIIGNIAAAQRQRDAGRQEFYELFGKYIERSR